ncbi:MAG: response regulator [Alphaproteobacteria bacterium]|nr:response regulator [Alphaproteobacteria bacterium]
MAYILIVEHNQVTANYLTAVLKKNHHSVTLTDNCMDAWQLATQERFDFLLVDVILPGVDGFVLAQKALQDNPNLQVVFITGFAGVTLDTPFASDYMTTTIVTRHFHLTEIVGRIRYMMGLGSLPLKSFPSESADNVIYADFVGKKNLSQQHLSS